jgi:hypothetical protein
MPGEKNSKTIAPATVWPARTAARTGLSLNGVSFGRPRASGLDGGTVGDGSSSAAARGPR